MAVCDSKRIPVNRQFLARIFSKIKVSTENFYKGVPCWEWQAAIGVDDYAYFCSSGKFSTERAHRLIYQMFVEIIPSRKQKCDHLCRIRHCVNPAHIEIVTNKENTLRGYSFSAENARKTHCKYGHPLSGSNVYKRKDRLQRGCRICRNNATLKYHANRKK